MTAWIFVFYLVQFGFCSKSSAAF